MPDRYSLPGPTQSRDWVLASTSIVAGLEMTVKANFAFPVSQGRIGIAAAKSTQAIVVARHPETVPAGPVTVTVTGLTKYLKEQGY